MFGSGGGFGGGLSFGGEKADITGGFETVQQHNQPQVKLDFSGFDGGKKESIFSNPGAASNKAKVNMSSGGMGSGNGMAGSMFGSGNASFNSFSGNASSNAAPAQAQTSVLSSSSAFSSFANNSSSLFGNTSFNSSQPSNQQPSSIFGNNSSQPSNQQPSSIFGGNSNAGNSIFGNDSNASVLNNGPTTSIFGNDNSNSTSIFGNDTSNSTSIFGNPESNADSAKPSIFGNSESKPSDSLFSGANQTFAEPKSSSLFDNQKSDSDAKSSLFSGTSLFSNSDKPITSTSLFGKPSNSTTEEPKSALANSSPSKTSTSLFGDSSGSSLFSSATSKPADAPSIFGKSSLFSAPAANPPVATTEEGGGEKGSIQDVYKERLRKVYAEKNPDKLAKLDGFLSKYAGQEHSLYEKVCKKYSVKVQPEYKGFSSQTSVSVSFPPPENVQKEGESSSVSLFPVDGPVAPAAKTSSIFSSPSKDSGSSKPKAKEKVPLFSEKSEKSDISSIFPPNSIFSGAEGSPMFTLKADGTVTKDPEPPKTQEPKKKEETDLTKLTLTQFVKRSNQLATQFMTPAERDMDKTVIANQTSPEVWREYAFKRVEEIYQECAPEKVKKVPALKTKYHGKETYMLQQICKKNKKPMELPPYPLRKEFGKVCLMPSAYLDGGAYPELHKSYEMQFPPPFNVEDNVESKAPASKAVEPKAPKPKAPEVKLPEPKAPEVKISEPKAPEPKVQLTPATLVKQGEPSVSMSRPNLVADQFVSISRADLADLPDVETSRPDIFINSEPGSLKNLDKTPSKSKAEPGKTITLTNILANSKKGASESSSSLFETRSDIFDTRTSLLEPEKPKATLAPPKKVEKSKPKKEEKLKIVNYESSSDEDEEPKISRKIQPVPKDDPSPPQKDEMEKYKDKLRFRVDPASFDTVASSGVEHSFLDAMKFVTEQSKKISLYTLQVDDALEEFEGRRNQELNENISKLQLNMKSIIKGTNKNIDSINQVCHIYGDVESHVGQTNRIQEIAKDENFRKEFEERPLTKQAKQMRTQLREQLEKVSTIMQRIEEKVADRKAVESNKLFQVNNNDNLITTTCGIGRLVQQAVQRTCEVELKIDLIKGKRNDTACELLLSKPEVNYLTGVYELKSSEKAKPPPQLKIPKAGPNKLIPLSPARKALKSPPKRLSTDYVDKMIKSFIQLKPPSVKDAPKNPESDLQEKIQESKFKSPLTVIGKVVPRKYRRRVGALSKLQEKPPDFDYVPPPPPKIVAKPPKPPPAPPAPAAAPAAPAEKKVLFDVAKPEEKNTNPLVSAPMTAQKSGPADAPQDAAKKAAPPTMTNLFPPTKPAEKSSETTSIFGKKPADKPAESTSIFGKKAEEKPAEKASIFGNKEAAKPAGGSSIFGNNAPSSGGSLFSNTSGTSGGSLFNNASSNSNANAGAETGTVYDVYKARLVEIYQAKNPSKVSKVDQFLKKYAGKEHALYSKVCKKYGMTPKGQYTPGAPSGGGMFSNKKAKVNMNMGGNSNAAPGLFNNQNSNNNSSIFGSNSTTSLFGNNNQNNSSNNNNNSNSGGSLFGNNNNQNSGGSLFGIQTVKNGGMFGNNNNQNNNNQGSSLFGNNQSSGGGLFGNNNNQNNGGGMFGNNNNNGGGMFGNNNNQNNGGGMFGNNNSNNGFNSNNQQESGTVQQVYAQRLQVIYQKFAPNKLGNIPKVMQKYRGNEHAMYIKVCQKYRINPQNQYTGGNMGGNSAGSMFGNSGGSLFGNNNNNGGGMFGNNNNNNNGGMFGNNNNNSGGMFGNNNSNNSGPSGFSSFASGGSVFGGNNNSNNNHTQFFP